MHGELRVHFFGGDFTVDAIRKYRGLAPSSSYWIRGFCLGLRESGASVHCFADAHDQLWPKGSLFPGNEDELFSNNQSLVKFCNAPVLRNLSLARSLVKASACHANTHGMPHVILTYNLYPYYLKAARTLSKQLLIPWIPIILDYENPRQDDWGDLLSKTESAIGCVFLSWWGFENAPMKNKIHLDAGVAEHDISEIKGHSCRPEDRYILYSGKLGRGGGLHVLLKAFDRIKDENVKLVVCGKGVDPVLTESAARDSRIVVKGFVEDDELIQLCQNASCLVNPRQTSMEDNYMTFPSKIMFYLSFLRPVVSCATPGVAPYYHQFLTVPATECDHGLADAIMQTLDGVYRPEDWARQRSWLLSNKRWSVQGRRFCAWAQQLISDQRATSCNRRA